MEQLTLQEHWERYFGLNKSEIPNIRCCILIAGRVLEKRLARDELKSKLIWCGMEESVAEYIANNS